MPRNRSRLRRVEAACGPERALPVHVLIEGHGAARGLGDRRPRRRGVDRLGLMDFVSWPPRRHPGNAMKSPASSSIRWWCALKADITAARARQRRGASHNVTTELQDVAVIRRDAERPGASSATRGMWEHPPQPDPADHRGDAARLLRGRGSRGDCAPRRTMPGARSATGAPARPRVLPLLRELLQRARNTGWSAPARPASLLHWRGTRRKLPDQTPAPPRSSSRTSRKPASVGTRLALPDRQGETELRLRLGQRQVAHARDPHRLERRRQHRHAQPGGHQADLVVASRAVCTMRGSNPACRHSARNTPAGRCRHRGKLMKSLRRVRQAHLRSARQPVGGIHDQAQRIAPPRAARSPPAASLPAGARSRYRVHPRTRAWNCSGVNISRNCRRTCGKRRR